MASDLSSNAAGLVSESVAALSSPSSSLGEVMSVAPDAMATQESYGWLGLFGWLIWFILHFVSTILYWIIRIATINLPTILYSLFSTSWTVTMNATTLYV